MFVHVRQVSRLLLIGLLPLVVGCGTGLSCDGKERKVKLDRALIEKYSLKEADFEQLQYYLANDLVLTREVAREDKRERVQGKLVQREGEVVEEVVIEKGTPGICLGSETKSSGAHWLEISFEEGTSFKFGREGPEDVYTVLREPRGDVIEVEYAGNTYRANKKQGAAAYLVVGEQSLKKAEKKTKELPGRRLPRPEPAEEEPEAKAAEAEPDAPAEVETDAAASS